MKIEDVRNSFTVYLIASDAERLSGLGETLGLAGYMTANFTELTAAFSEFFSNPPHFVLFDLQESQFNLKKAIKQVAAQLPETHILLVTPVEYREQAAGLLEHGVSDIILTPVATPVELVRTLDRWAERDYFMYLNEQLSAKTSGAEALQPEMPTDLHLNYARELFERTQVDECIGVFLRTASTMFSDAPSLFFKYFANRRVLAVTQYLNVGDTDTSGVGVNFNELNPGFRASQLRDPSGLPEIEALIREVFQTSSFVALPLESFGEVMGIIVLLIPDPEPAALGILRDWMMLLNRAITMVESEKRLHVLAVKDPNTDLYTRAVFLDKVRQEVSRARRTSMPVALLQIAVDQYGRIVSEIGLEEAQTYLKVLARILEKHSRVNDIIGRTGADEFGIILPHTGRQGALIKAERLRRLVESADFSKVLKSFPRITISVGVAEYPTMVRDAEELGQYADEALFQVRTQGNKTCVAKAPDGFAPDFVAREKSE